MGKNISVTQSLSVSLCSGSLLDGELDIPIYFDMRLDTYFWKNILKIKLKYLLRISKSVVRLIRAIANNGIIPDSDHNLDAALIIF